jgi:polar amino acid transport system substrate-binding protein
MLRRSLIRTAGLLAITTAARPAFAAPTVMEEIKARGTLRAGLSTFMPWAMRDKTGKLIGYELDVGARLAADLGVKYEPIPTAWDGIIPALLAGSFDLIIGGMTITPARAQSVDFTEPYSFTGVAMVANKKVAPGLNSLEAFNKPSITLVVRRGTGAVAVAQEKMPLATLRQFDDDAPALQELLNGNAAALLASTPKPAFAAVDHAAVLYLPLDKPIVAQRDAMAIRKGEPATTEALNNWIAARKNDGFLAERFHYWFEDRSWLSQVQG